MTLHGIRGRFARLHPTVLAAGWVSLVTDFSSEMIFPLLPLFLTSVLGAGAAFLGLLEGAAETTSSLLKIVSGRLSDRPRMRKRLVLGGYLVSALARPVVAVAAAPWHVLSVRLADRVGKGVRTSPRDALVADCTSPADRGLAFGFQRSMDNAGALIGPLAASGLLWALGTAADLRQETALRIVFALAAVPGALAPLIVWRKIVDTPARLAAAGAEDPPGRSRTPGLGAPFNTYVAVVVLFTLGNSSDAFLVLRASDAGVPAWQLPLLWAAFHAVKSSGSLVGGGLADRWGRRRLIGVGWAVYALSYLLFGFAEAPWQVWAIFGLYGLYHGSVEGAERALVADLVPAGRRGAAYGVFNAAVGTAALPASLLFGALWQWAGGPRVPFLVGAGFAAAALALLPFVPKPEPRREH